MQQTHASEQANGDGDAVGRALSNLRDQIDALDDELLDLVERRLAASRSIAALKSSRGDGHLCLRPRREQEVIARLTRRASLAPQPMVEHLWREIMAYCLQEQVRTELVVHGPDAAALVQRARARFGSAAPVRLAASAGEALDAAAGEEAVAVIGVDGASDWTGRLGDLLSIFDWIRDEQGWKVAAVVGRVPPEEHPDPLASPARAPEAGR